MPECFVAKASEMQDGDRRIVVIRRVGPGLAVQEVPAVPEVRDRQVPCDGDRHPAGTRSTDVVRKVVLLDVLVPAIPLDDDRTCG